MAVEGHQDLLCLLLQRYTFWSNSQRSMFVIPVSFNCACYCKDTHFEAIHNRELTPPTMTAIVLATAKIHILKQFTTSGSFISWATYCACYCKDTHFEAIHNFLEKPSSSGVIVLATAKIHILKQFTTEIVSVRLFLWLCLLLQRYTFWSNSQLKTAFWSRI